MEMDYDLLRVVWEDLEYLATEWSQGIDDASLRRSSPVLRNLLVDGCLPKAARLLNQEVRVLAPEINRHLDDNSLRTMAFFQSGGAKYRGNIVAFVRMERRAKSPNEIKRTYEQERAWIGKNYPVKLSVFLRQTSIVVDGVFITREEIVKYVANKLGGTHYDPDRTGKSSAKQALEDKYALLDKVREGMVMCDKNAIYYELLSIGQRLVNSRDVRQLKKGIKQHLNTQRVVVGRHEP